MSRQTEWTAADMAAMERMIGEGKTFREIGEAIGRSRHSCHSRWRDYGAFKRRPAAGRPQEQMDWLAEQVANGHSIRSCAKAANVAVSTAWVWWRRICADLGPQAV